jgi:hypothetical protein
MIDKPTDINLLGFTTRWTVAARALESAREDCLFRGSLIFRSRTCQPG